MSTSAMRKSFHSLSTLVAALSLVSTCAVAQVAQPEPVGVYLGASAGVGVAKWDCGSTCNRSTFSGKLFGGKYFTPGYAVEINYFVFGGADRSNNAVQTTRTGIASERRRANAVTFGILKDVPLLENFTNQIRVGLAYVKYNQTAKLANGSFKVSSDQAVAPYVGLGLGFEVAPDLRLTSSFDYIINGKGAYMLFGVGASADF